jgi:hypothetical protein
MLSGDFAAAVKAEADRRFGPGAWASVTISVILRTGSSGVTHLVNDKSANGKKPPKPGAVGARRRQPSPRGS